LGALRGSLTFSRFFVWGDVPADLATASLTPIGAFTLRPLEPDEDDFERHGWCSMRDAMDLELDHEKVFFNEYLCLGLRVDKWVVPKPLLEMHLREAEAKLREQKGVERLGRKAKADLKLMITKRLRRNLVPVTKAVDLVWNVNTGVVHFFSQASRLQELMMEIFERTFHLRLLPESPAVAAERVGMSDEESHALDKLEQTSLFRGEAS